MKDQSKPIEERGAWKVLSKKQIYSNSWIKLEEHQVINPGGGCFSACPQWIDPRFADGCWTAETGKHDH